MITLLNQMPDYLLLFYYCMLHAEQPVSYYNTIELYFDSMLCPVLFFLFYKTVNILSQIQESVHLHVPMEYHFLSGSHASAYKYLTSYRSCHLTQIFYQPMI